MLKIHKPFSKHKLFLISITSICIAFGLLGFYYLTYAPELSHAETVTYPEKETRTMGNITYMQDITPEICQNSELNKQYTLTDIRDNNTYTVARIKNQTDEKTNCWMTQNLRIIDKEISHLDSDMESGSFTIPSSSISGFNSGDQNQSKAYYHPAYGGYYNWYTATAGSGDSTVNRPLQNASGSICPTGWHLPLSGLDSTNDFYKLLDKVKVSAATASPYNFISGAGRIHESARDNTSTSSWWSSTASATDDYPEAIYIFQIYGASQSSNTYPTSATSRIVGLSVRCLTAGREREINNNVNIAINKSISLDMANEVAVDKTETNPSTVNLDVKVSSNQKYSLGISATNPNLISSTSNVKIPAKSGLLNTAENGWGIKLSSDTSYTALTNTLQTFYTASGAEVKIIPFTIGISTALDLPSGEYSTDITVTATQN